MGRERTLSAVMSGEGGSVTEPARAAAFWSGSARLPRNTHRLQWEELMSRYEDTHYWLFHLMAP